MSKLISQLIENFFRLLGLKSLESQFLISFILIFICGISVITSQYLTMGNDATAINIAGRQRMLSQRLAKEAWLVAQKVEQVEVLNKTIDLFESSHAKLLQGDPKLGMAAVTDSIIIEQLMLVERLWGEYKTAIRAYLDNPGDARQIHQLSPQVLKEMNKAVGMMATESNQQVKTQQLISLLATILLLTLIYLGRIFGKEKLMRKIHRLKGYLQNLSQGDFSQPILRVFARDGLRKITLAETLQISL